MDFELHRHVPLADESRRLILGQLQDAAVALRADDVVEGVHDARKAIKRARATLRVFRDVFGEPFAAANTALRNHARRLSELRDRHALGEAIETLGKRRPDLAEAQTALRAIVLAPDPATSADAERALIGDVEAELTAEAKRFEEIPLSGDAVAALRRGLRRSYRRARRAMRAAYAEPTMEQFHAWRRRVKDVTYQWQMLRPAWPEVFDGFVKGAKQLGDALGEDHDAALLVKVLMTDPRIAGRERTSWLAAIDEVRNDLRSRARHLGRRLFAESSRDYVDRLLAWFCAWQDEARHGHRESSD